MMKADFFAPGEIERIIVIYCTSKVGNILTNYQKTKLFLCSKDGYEGIYSKETKEDEYYKPLLDLRNAFKEIVVEEQTINVLLSDGELLVIGCLSLDENVSSKKIKRISSMLEKIRDTEYSSSEIEQYNLIIQAEIKKYHKNYKKNYKNKKDVKKNDKRNKVFLSLFIFSCVGLVYGFYNLKQFFTVKTPEYEIDGSRLSTFLYQNLNNIYTSGLKEKDKCKNNDISCLKTLETNIFYYKQNINNVSYDQKSQVLKFNCNLVPTPSINNFTQIQIDNYQSTGYKDLQTEVLKILPPEDANAFKDRLLKHGKCSYILSGIKDAYTQPSNQLNVQNIVPVKLDVYVWFDDDLSIFYHEQINNYGHKSS